MQQYTMNCVRYFYAVIHQCSRFSLYIIVYRSHTIHRCYTYIYSLYLYSIARQYEYIYVVLFRQHIHILHWDNTDMLYIHPVYRYIKTRQYIHLIQRIHATVYLHSISVWSCSVVFFKLSIVRDYDIALEVYRSQSSVLLISRQADILFR